MGEGGGGAPNNVSDYMERTDNIPRFKKILLSSIQKYGQLSGVPSKTSSSPKVRILPYFISARKSYTALEICGPGYPWMEGLYRPKLTQDNLLAISNLPPLRVVKLYPLQCSYAIPASAVLS